MPRTARASAANWVYHVINRGNGRAEVFHKDEDYAAFVRIMGDACERLPLRILGYCLMPNHFDLVLWPRHDLSRWMQWLLTSHVRRYHRHHGGSGHVWQGRFKAFPIQQDEHLLTVLGCVERNSLQAKLVARGSMALRELAPAGRRLRKRSSLAGTGGRRRGLGGPRQPSTIGGRNRRHSPKHRSRHTL